MIVEAIFLLLYCAGPHRQSLHSGFMTHLYVLMNGLQNLVPEAVSVEGLFV